MTTYIIADTAKQFCAVAAELQGRKDSHQMAPFVAYKPGLHQHIAEKVYIHAEADPVMLAVEVEEVAGIAIEGAQ